MKRMSAPLMMLMLTLAALLNVYCSSDDSTSPNELPIMCIDAHSQPPYPELGDDVDLQSIINSMDVNNVSVSILS